LQLLATARKRTLSPRSCTEADLRRAISDLYYALFHAVCEALVEPVGADPENPAFVDFLRGLYRIPEHHLLERRCKDALASGFSPEVRRFAQRVIALKNKRTLADYDFLEVFSISDVQSEIDLVESALHDLRQMPQADRVRFAMFVGLDPKRGR